MENSNLHLKIREERIKQGLSQKELGELVGLPQQAINRIEQGQRKLDIELFEKLCKALNIKKIGSFTVNFISSFYKMDVGDDPICPANNPEDEIPTDGSLLYDHSYSYVSSEEELNECLKQNEEDNDDSKKSPQFVSSGNNIHKYDASIRISPEALENLKEINIIYNKIENGEKLTENDLQALKDYSQRQKVAMERLKITLQTMQEKLEPLMELHPAYNKLNEVGQKEAIKRIEELAEISRYTKPAAPPQY